MWSNPLETAELVTFTEEILNGKLHFMGSARTGAASGLNQVRETGLLSNTKLPWKIYHNLQEKIFSVFFVNFNKAFSTKKWIIENYIHPLIPTNAAEILTS